LGYAASNIWSADCFPIALKGLSEAARVFADADGPALVMLPGFRRGNSAMPLRLDHSSKVYDAQLGKLHQRLLTMAATIEEMLTQGETALETRDNALAEAVRSLDRRVDQLECEVDELAMRLLAMRQPVASDLRQITTTFKFVVDLQRMGRSYANVCNRLVELFASRPLDVARQLTGLHRDVRDVVHDAISALSGFDADGASALLRRDAAIDEQYHRIFREVVDLMGREPEAVYRATRVQVIAKNLESMADHAMSIAKGVVFVATGTDIRHPE
jgi:phosphate transport system protein